MSPSRDGSNREEGAEMQGDVPRLMVQQAEAAAASEKDTSDETAEERKHMGRDVPTVERHSTTGTEAELPNHPPPAYGEHFGHLFHEHDGFGSNAEVADDGRVNIRIDQRSQKLSNYLVPALRHQQEITEHEAAPPPAYIPPNLGGEIGVPPPPPMNVVIQIVGSRGDVQPFIALGKVLKETYKHRVRVATHPNFESFVKEQGLEFFNIGGDPANLMAFMVKNPGLMPGFDALKSGDVGMRRKEVAEYLRGCWRSCFESGNGMGPEASDDTIEDWTAQQQEDPSSKPFVVDCIIANPPSFAHVHCAEKLGIPLHIMFTMPYSPTQAFPHPLANIQSSNADPNLTNYMSYALIDMLTWQGLGDVINRFRQKSLGLEPVSLVWAPGMLQRLKVPHTYCWSPALIPKPKDWGQNISISGFFFLDLATNYTPEPDLKAFLDAGPPPVYIGFGSIVCDDPNAMTRLIFDAVRITGQRCLLSKGWGGMGAEELGIPEGVFMLGNVPHDWLFKQVSCVVHHGGAGTTAAGITAGKPTVVVPFFGDQPFWGSMVARAGAGPEPIPHKELTGDNLAEAINFCLKPESQERAKELSSKIAKEKGSDLGCQSFHQMLDVDKLRCTLSPSRPAVWRLRRTQVRLSALAACTLANEGLLDFNDIKLFRAREYETDDGPWDPITGASTALIGTTTQMMMGVADLPVDTLKALKIHPATAKKKKPTEAGETSSESAQSGETAQSSEKTESLRRESTFSSSAISSGNATPTPETSRTNSSFNLQESLDRIKTPTSPGPRSSSMSDALKGQLSSSKSRSRSNSRTRAGSQSPKPDYLDTAVNTGKGVQKIVGAGFKSPMDFTMALAQGFHNAPKLYGDETVRKADKVTDFRSGLKAATKGFGFGMYDGISGLVSQPLKGAQKEGAAGFVKGIGKGIGGIVLKPSAAFFSIPGYTMKGVYKEMQKNAGSSVQNYIIAARTAQGYDEWHHSTERERQLIVERWKLLQKDIKKKKNPDELVLEILDEQKRKVKSGWEETKSRSRAGSRARSRGATLVGSPGTEAAPSAIMSPSQDKDGRAREEAEIEESIRLSVQQTSRGNAEEDAAIERAIRASMNELRQGQSGQQERATTEDDDDLKRAIEASTAEAQRQNQTQGEHDEELQKALAQSLDEHKSRDQPPAYDADAGHVAGTTRQEYESGQVEGEKSQQEKTEEQVVMEYVKKQSLLEQEHRQGKGGKGKAAEKDVDDEDLERAMKASMQTQGQQRGESSGT